MTGGYFQRAAGKKVQVVGSFRNFTDYVVNRGKPYSLNSDEGVLIGQTYEFLVKKLTATTGKFLGASLIFIFEPDGNAAMNISADSYFSVTKNISLTVQI